MPSTAHHLPLPWPNRLIAKRVILSAGEAGTKNLDDALGCYLRRKPRGRIAIWNKGHGAPCPVLLAGKKRMITHKFQIKTSRRTQMVEVTTAVRRVLADAGVKGGLCHVYVPHTTAGITINENADPDVVRDMEMAFDRMVPRDSGYHHAEGNSDSHIKTTLVGSSQTIFVEKGELQLGRWQGIFFCEFDGPRQREV